MYLGQFNVMLVRSIVETVVPIVIVNIAGMREAIKKGKHVFKAISVEMIVCYRYEEFVRGSERQLSDN